MRTGDRSRSLVGNAVGVAGAALLAVVTLVACSDPKAAPLPSLSPTVGVTPSTASPSAAGGDDLIRAVTHFYDVLESGSLNPASGADEVARLIAPGCPCSRIVEFLRSEGRKGHRIERPVELRDARAAVNSSGGGTVFATLAEGAGRVLDAHGATVERLSPSTSKIVVDVVAKDGLLLVSQIAVSSRG